VVYKRAAIALNFFQFKTYQLALKVRVVGDWTLPCLGRFFRSSVFSNVSSSALLAWLATTIENLADEFECWMGPNLYCRVIQDLVSSNISCSCVRHRVLHLANSEGVGWTPEKNLGSWMWDLDGTKSLASCVAQDLVSSNISSSTVPDVHT
jgi:hypothetical protein